MTLTNRIEAFMFHTDKLNLRIFIHQFKSNFIMQIRLNHVVAILAVIVAVACDSKTKTKDEHSAQSPTDENQTIKRPEKEIKGICMWDKLAVRETGTTKGKWVTSINLGEQFEFLNQTHTDETTGKKRVFVKIRLLDGIEGWVREDLVAINAKIGALKNDTPIYKRPDLLAQSDKLFYKMDVVAVFEQKEGWIRVKGIRKDDTWYTSGWIKKNQITDKEIDVATAILTNQALKLEKQDKIRNALNSIRKNSSLNGAYFMNEVHVLFDKLSVDDEPVEELETKQDPYGEELSEDIY